MTVFFTPLIIQLHFTPTISISAHKAIIGFKEEFQTALHLNQRYSKNQHLEYTISGKSSLPISIMDTIGAIKTGCYISVSVAKRFRLSSSDRTVVSSRKSMQE